MLSFSQCDIFSQLQHNWHYKNVYSISLTYTYSTVYNYTTEYADFACTYASFSQCDIFSQSLPNSLYNNVYSISSTYTYSTIYNYTTRYTNFAVYICCPFYNVIFFHNHCTIDSTTMSIAYPQHIHTILFTITLRSMLTLLFTYASFSQCDIFSQSLHNWLYNNVYSISVTYTYSTVCNCSPQYTYFDVYMCFHFHNVNIFPHITVQLSKYNVYIEYSPLPKVLFTITLPSILILLLTYAFLFTM